MRLIPRGLYGRLLLIVSLIVIVTIFAYSWFTAKKQSENYLRSTELNAKVMAENLAIGCINYLIISDYAGMELFLMRSAEFPDILGIQVYDNKGHALSDIVHNRGSLGVRFGSAPLKVPDSVQTYVQIKDGQMIVLQPIVAGSLLGWVKIIYNMDTLTEMRSIIWKNSIFLGIIGIIISFIALMVVLRPPIHSIRRIADFARRLDEIKGEAIPLERSSVEIEQLNSAFNYASQKLQSTEKAIKESEERYHNLFDNAHDLIQSVSPDGHFIFVNPSWTKTLGYTQDDLRAIAIFDVLHPDSKQHCMEIFKKVMSGETVDNIETTFIAKDGRLIDVEGSVSAKMSGEIAVAAQGIFRDVTRRKKAEEQLKGLLKDVTKAKAEWEMTFNNAMEIIILLDKDLGIIKCNKRFVDFVGLPSQELLGRKCYEFFTCNPEHTGHCIGKIHDGELREWTEIRANTGHWFYISHCPIFDERGEFLHSIVIAADITSLKNTQKRLQDSEEELESLFMNFVKAMVNALDAKSPWTKGHSERVANYAEHTAKEMGLAEEEIRNIHLSGLLHDIGKIGTYDYLLDKPETLTEEEFDAVKQHPLHGVGILKGIKQLKNIIPLIRCHHERIDGKGYPDGLIDNEIPLSAKILHVADAFDSMTADRPYRPSPGIDYAISELKKCSGTWFDAKVVESFLRVIARVYKSPSVH